MPRNGAHCGCLPHLHFTSLALCLIQATMSSHTHHQSLRSRKSEYLRPFRFFRSLPPHRRLVAPSSGRRRPQVLRPVVTRWAREKSSGGEGHEVILASPPLPSSNMTHGFINSECPRGLNERRTPGRCPVQPLRREPPRCGGMPLGRCRHEERVPRNLFSVSQLYDFSAGPSTS